MSKWVISLWSNTLCHALVFTRDTGRSLSTYAWEETKSTAQYISKVMSPSLTGHKTLLLCCVFILFFVLGKSVDPHATRGSFQCNHFYWYSVIYLFFGLGCLIWVQTTVRLVHPTFTANLNRRSPLVTELYHPMHILLPIPLNGERNVVVSRATAYASIRCCHCCAVCVLCIPCDSTWVVPSYLLLRT